VLKRGWIVKPQKIIKKNCVGRGLAGQRGKLIFDWIGKTPLFTSLPLPETIIMRGKESECVDEGEKNCFSGIEPKVKKDKVGGDPDERSRKAVVKFPHLSTCWREGTSIVKRNKGFTGDTWGKGRGKNGKEAA